MTWRAIAVASVTVEGAQNQICRWRPEILQRLDIHILVAFATRMINPPLFVFDGVQKCGGAVEFSGSKALGTLQVLLAMIFCTREKFQIWSRSSTAGMSGSWLQGLNLMAAENQSKHRTPQRYCLGREVGSHGSG